MTKLGSPIDACAMTSKVRFSRSYATCSASAAPAPSECTLIWVQCQHTLINLEVRSKCVHHENDTHTLISHIYYTYM